MGELSDETDDLIAQLKGERGTALQGAQCYKAQRDLAWAEIDRLKEQVARVEELADLWEMEAVEQDDLHIVTMIRIALKG